MIENFEHYFNVAEDTPKYNKKADSEAEEKRYNKATEQAEKKPVPYLEVCGYINEFLDECCSKNGGTDECKVDSIDLQEGDSIVVGNGIIVKDCKWIENIWDDGANKYSQFERKYLYIKNKYGLTHSKNILWFKFTIDGYLGVVAKGQDINFDYGRFSGKCVKSVSKQWDESFVLIFPLTDAILGNKKSSLIETGVGNYLSQRKDVPIIDFYSHNY